MVYRNFSSYLREKYGKRLGKICIDGGFTCPNRDGTAGYGGCTFCGERGAGEHIASGESVAEQVKKALAAAKADDLFIAYFQNFTGTYAPVEKLAELYSAALCDRRIVALAVGTRPDCITEENAALIASYAGEREVWVELGLQSANDRTAAAFNRGYKSEVFARAVGILASHGIRTVAHIMIGLPGEGERELRETLHFLAPLPLWGIKIHSLYVMRATKLAALYEAGEFQPISEEEYISRAAFALAHISPDLIVHRLTGDCPRGLLVAPAWNTEKSRILAGIVSRMEENGWVQGCLFGEATSDGFLL